MLPIASAHTMPKEPPELLREMTEGATETGVPTTLHPMMSAFNPISWKSLGLPDDFALNELDLHEERTEIYQRCGFIQYGLEPLAVRVGVEYFDKIHMWREIRVE